MTWEMVGVMCASWTADTWINLGTAVITAFLTSGVIAAWHQLRQTRNNTVLQLIDSTASYLRSDEALEALKSIYHLNPEQVKSLKLNHQQRRVLETLETLGEMVNEKLVDEKPIVRIWAGILALRCWYKLCDYIEGQRPCRGTIYCENLEDLASRAIAYAQKKRRPTQNWIKLNGKDIIDEINKGHVLRPMRINERRRS
jgi:hypothetical protein